MNFHAQDPKIRNELSGLFFKRLVGILKENQVEYDKKVLAKFILNKAPDWRGVINTIQGSISNGVLPESILGATTEALVEFIEHKKWNQAQEWIFENSFMHPLQIQSELFHSLMSPSGRLTNMGRPAASLIFGNYAQRISQGADPYITLTALVTELMMDDSVEFK